MVILVHKENGMKERWDTSNEEHAWIVGALHKDHYWFPKNQYLVLGHIFTIGMKKLIFYNGELTDDVNKVIKEVMLNELRKEKLLAL